MIRRVMILGFSLAVAPAAGAQVTGWMDVGVGQGSSGAVSDRGVVSLAPSLAFRRAAWDLQAHARWADWAGPFWGGGAGFSARYRIPLGSGIRMVPGLRGSWERAPTRTSGGSALLGLGLEGDAGDIAWSADVRGGAGTDGTVAFPVGRVEGAASRRFGSLSFGLGVVWTTITGGRAAGSRPRLPGTIDQVAPDTSTRGFPGDFADALISADWHGRLFDVGTGLGRRFGRDAGAMSWQAHATWWIQPGVGIVGSIGRYPADLISGRPSGDYHTLGLRLALPGKVATDAGPGSRVRPSRGGLAFTAARLPDDQVLLRVRLPGADRVRIMGDFTAWRIVDLMPGPSGTWTARLRIPPGRHEVNIQVDDGPWDVPPGLPAVDDGFGGAAGVFMTE